MGYHHIKVVKWNGRVYVAVFPAQELSVLANTSRSILLGRTAYHPSSDHEHLRAGKCVAPSCRSQNILFLLAFANTYCMSSAMSASCGGID